MSVDRVLAKRRRPRLREHRTRMNDDDLRGLRGTDAAGDQRRAQARRNPAHSRVLAPTDEEAMMSCMPLELKPVERSETRCNPWRPRSPEPHLLGFSERAVD